MKALVNNLRPQDTKIFTHVRIDCGTQLFRSDFTMDDCTRNLAFGVNACISSSRSMNNNIPAFNQRESSCQFSLNGSQFILDLPAVKVGAVVLKKESVVQG
jgi:hypothetical protein